MGDWMHTTHLGVLLHLLGSTIADMTEAGVCFSARTVEGRFEEFPAALEHAYDECNETKRIQSVTPSMIGDRGKWPTLSCKANEASHLVHVILCMLRKLMNRTTLDKHRIAAYEFYS